MNWMNDKYADNFQIKSYNFAHKFERRNEITDLKRRIDV